MHQSNGTYWRKLDNAAKLFPAASNKRDTRVFRFYCDLKEEIQQELLQKALEQTLETYPVFLSVLRKGLFWHYLERSALKPVVREEYKEPCSPLYIRDKKTLLFEVTYYKKRINFEVFHVLTDGTGAGEFIRELVKNYLLLSHREEGLGDIRLNRGTVTVSDQEADGFSKYYSKPKKKKREKKHPAHQIRKNWSELGSLQLTEAEISAEALSKKAKEYGVSMTVFLTAVYLCAIHRRMSKRQEEKSVILMIPVNLRKFFPSDSMLNFFNWIEPGFRFGQEDDSFEAVLQAVKQCFSQELTEEKMAERMNEYIALEVNPILRFAPLEVKNLCINAGAKVAAKDVTAIFSNMGKIEMPEEYAVYIERFGVYTSTPKVELCMCSFEGKVYLGFTSRFDSSAIKKNFFQILNELGIEVKILEPDFPEEAAENTLAAKLFKIISFLSVLAMVIVVSMDYMLHDNYKISLVTGGGVACMWGAIAVGYHKRYNLLKNAMWQLVLVSSAAVLWDIFTGWRAWSVSFVFPIVSLIIMISMMVLSRIYYQSAKDYMIYFVMASGYGLISSLIFLMTGLARYTLPSVICLGFSVIFVAGLVIFRWKEFKEEMQKKFHI